MTDEITRRAIEKLKPGLLQQVKEEMEAERSAACAAGNHVWKRVAYDLQGGKWGTEMCIHCGKKETWNANDWR